MRARTAPASVAGGQNAERQWRRHDGGIDVRPGQAGSRGAERRKAMETRNWSGRHDPEIRSRGAERRKAMETLRLIAVPDPVRSVAGGQNAERQWRLDRLTQVVVVARVVAGGQNAERQWRLALELAIMSTVNDCVAGGQNAERQWRPRASARAVLPRPGVAGGQNAERQWRQIHAHRTLAIPIR